MPLFQISMPSNAGLFFKEIMSIAAFDFYDFSDVIHDNFQISPTDPIDTNFETIGFESSYFLINMGTMMLFYMYYILCLLVKSILQPFATKHNKRIRKFYRKLRNNIIWGSLITLINETYAIIVLSVLINLQIVSFETHGLAWMSTLCIIFMILAITVPAIMMGKLWFNVKHLEEPRFKRDYGKLYEELNPQAGTKILLQPSFFLLRRLLLALAVSSVGQTLIWQIYLMTAQIIIQIIIIGSNIYESRSKSNLEYFNEIILLFVLYTVFCFSPWIYDAEIKFNIGYLVILVVMLHIVVNLLLMLISTCKLLKTKCRRKFVMRRYRRDRKKSQSHLDQNHAKRIVRTLKLRKQLFYDDSEASSGPESHQDIEQGVQGFAYDDQPKNILLDQPQ